MTTPAPDGGEPRSGAGPRIGLVAALVAVTSVALGLAAFLAVAAQDNDATTTASARAESGAGSEGTGWRGIYVADAPRRPDFTLTTTDGQPYDFQAETAGTLTLLFFGYTSCPDVCPIHMATLSAALEQPGMPDPTVVFVTTDPDRDTPERLRSWLDTFDADFVGLRGTREQVRAAEDAAGVAASIVETDSGAAEGDDYVVGHAAQIIAYTPDDLAHVVYPFGVRRQDWQTDLPRLVDTWGTAVLAEEAIWVDGAWMATATETSAVYLAIENGGADDRLVGAASDVAGSVSMMGRVDAATAPDAHAAPTDGVDRPVPSGTTTFAPGGGHIMLADLARPLEPGDTVRLQLTFERAGRVDVEVEVVSWDEAVERTEAGATAAGAGDGS